MKPIQAGDHAEIIEGALGTKGPNVGNKSVSWCRVENTASTPHLEGRG
ncbi:hypothetical protein [Aquabacterium sp. CECT 9606]|nr:hypothetical protein [Aquabacterium sp. CECT 9606]CAH0355532.1 hypothetical protein AQB9606_04260 [Aquabacterium sp. CECT 9606]